MLGMCIESTSCTACKKVFAANATGQRDSPTQDAWHVLSVSSDSDNYLLIPLVYWRWHKPNQKPSII